MGLTDRIQHAWNAFMNRDPTNYWRDEVQRYGIKNHLVLCNVPNGAIMDTAYYAITDTAQVVKEFELIPLTDGVSFNIKPAGVNALHAQQSGSHMVNWAGGAGSASAWLIEFAVETPKVTSTTGVESNVRIRVVNRTVEVEGAASYEIYSVTGQRMQKNAALNTGIYIVRTPELTAKVLVR